MTCKSSSRNEWSQKIFKSHNKDPESKLGTYLTINPTLIKPDRNLNLMEHERIILTRFRTGSHNLRIETGRWSNEEKNQRLCQCNTDIQTANHFFMECPLLTHLRGDYTSLYECFKSSDDIVHYIVRSAKILKIEL